MNYPTKFNLQRILFVCLALALFGMYSCEDKGAELVLDETTTTNVEAVWPNTSTGRLVRDHLRLAMGHGMDAEEKYQQSLSRLQTDSLAGSVLYEGYSKVTAENYFYRTMIVEALKGLQSGASLNYLNDIASERIPADRYPENAEIDTRIDEIVIRITAVEGITRLANDSLVDANAALVRLMDNKDLTVRQMAARGYIMSPIGNKEEKIQELMERLPKAEHWYLTGTDTDIKKVKHPDMPEEFEIIEKETKDAPKIKQQ
ncbi:MAG: hypothetical protein HKO54_08840 [Flavobacteriaceae bacterium]|nr:hypothetical protein [Flavobacteriaceae bacterium]